jgi:hypothetical protein
MIASYIFSVCKRTDTQLIVVSIISFLAFVITISNDNYRAEDYMLVGGIVGAIGSVILFY